MSDQEPDFNMNVYAPEPGTALAAFQAVAKAAEPIAARLQENVKAFVQECGKIANGTKFQAWRAEIKLELERDHQRRALRRYKMRRKDRPDE